jgi:acylphosphatase
MSKRRAHVWIRGFVQGVCFRAFARDAAVREGVTGWVRNLRDGRVEAVFEGDTDQVARMVAWCREGSPLGSVDEVVVREEPFEGSFDRFEITYGR